jgi:23S rRNA G2445 N2-methylase RlmL
MATPVNEAAPKKGERFIATASPGLESLLSEELRELGVEEPAIEGPGAVAFNAGWESAVEVLLRSRIASRVLWSLRSFSAKNAAMLYDQVRRLEWPTLIPPGLTIAVEATGKSPSPDLAMSFIPLKIKDGICDEFRKHGFERPNVERFDPDARISAHFHEGKCELSIDLAGRPLHRRGYRADGGAAPLRENRAAALLRFAGYDGTQPFADAFCGSGTLVIEAALIALKVAPGTLREPGDFALSKIRPRQRELLEKSWLKARREVLSKPAAPILGRDVSEAILKHARANAEKAGLAPFIDFAVEDARETTLKDSTIVSNPPYGERMGEVEAAGELIADFASRLKHHGGNTRLALILPAGPLEKAVGLRAAGRYSVENGPIASKFLRYDIFPGKGR